MRIRSALVALILCFILPIVALAQDKATPQGLIVEVEPAERKISLELRLNRDCFVPKQRATVRFWTDRATYVYIYNIDSKGRVWLLFPNGFSREPWVSKGEHLLPDSDRYSLVIEGPAGVEYIQAIASLYPIPWLEYRGDKPFRLLSTKAGAGKFSEELERWLKRSLPKGSWAIDWVEYGVSWGKLIVRSWPPEAEVYVDGRFLGMTRSEGEDEPAKLELWLGKGYHHVLLTKEGFGSRSRSIYLGACETEELEFRLERPGRVLIDSRPQGAAIYVDGRYRGETPTELELEPGWHTIELRKLDYKIWSRKIWLESGELEEIYARLWANFPPVARAEFVPPEPVAGEEVLFDASGSYDPDGTIISYRWDFDGDGEADAEGPKVSRKFQSFGRHEVRLTVTDEDGGSDSISMGFLVHARPVAEFSFSPREPHIGDRIQFDASASHDPDGRIVAYEWDFGDGAMAEGMSATHVYDMPGTYTVTLWVRDDGLEARVVRSIGVVRGGVLSISSIPAGAEVYLDEEYIGVTPLTAKLAEGSYQITLKREGYKDWSTDVRIPEQDQIAAELVPWGRLTLWSDPPGAGVYLDGRLVGETTAHAQGLTLYLDPEGKHRLELSLCGYKIWSADVALKSGETQEIRAELEPIREVSIETDPPGAAIWLAGRYYGKTPAKITLDPAVAVEELTLALVKEGYKRWSTSCITDREIEVSLRKNEPPLARISCPDRGTALEEIGFSAFTSVDPDGRIVEYRWDFGDGTTAAGVTALHQFKRPGTYRVELTVVDDEGAESRVTKDILIESHPPLARLSGPAEGRVGEELTFSGEGSEDPDGEIVEYRWDFGDGATTTGQTASHRFEGPGTYTVRLTVVDDHGASATETMEVEVLTELGLFIAHLQELSVPRPPALEFNLGFGRNGEGVRSVGLAVGDWFMLGGSFSFTGEEVPDYYRVPPQPWEGEVYNSGPELELCALVATPFIAGVSLEGGVGLSFQQQVHIATMTPPASQEEAGLVPQRAVVKPNGYREWKTYLTMLGGISIRLGEMFLSLDYHSRRGWMIGVGIEL